MGSKQIQIHCPDQFVRGEKTQVEIVVNFHKPTKVRGIHAVFYGREETEANYTTTETDHKGRSKSVSKTAHESVEIVKQNFLLLGNQKKGFFSGLGDSLSTMFGGGSAEVIEPGEKRFTIDVMVPGGAPASMKGNQCRVVYEVQVSVDIPVQFDLTKSKSVSVSRPPVDFSDTQHVHVVFPDKSGPSFWDKTFGKDVTMNLAIDRNIICPGENAMAMLTIDSPAPFKVKRIQCSLVGKVTTQARGHSDGSAYTIPLGTIDSPSVIAGQSTHEFEIFVDLMNHPYSQTGTNFWISWSVEVRLDVPWAKDPVIQAPVELHPTHAEKSKIEVKG